MIYPRCPFCDHENRLHTGGGVGCAKCSCLKSPRDIMEERLRLLEEDFSRQAAILADVKIRLDAIELSTRAYGIIA